MSRFYLRDPRLLDCISVAMNAAPDERAQIEALSGESYDVDSVALNAFNLPGPKWVAVDTETQKPLVVAGFTPLRPGVYAAWFLADRSLWATHGRNMTRATRKVLSQMLSYGDYGYKCHRIERSVLSSREGAKRWYGSIGLQHESTLRQYGAGGEDFDLYVLTKTPESD